MRAEATTDGKRILVRTETFSQSDFEAALAACKAVGGGRWQKTMKAWAYPQSVETCLRLRQAFGDALLVTPALSEWYRQAAAETAAHTALSAATDADLHRLPVVAPALAATLRPDQRAGARWVADGYRGSGLVADKPGLGKTLETIAGILESEDDPGPIIVICPRLSVRPVWQKEFQKWTSVPTYAARGTRAQREKAIDAFHADPSHTKVLIVVAEMLRIKGTKKAGKYSFEGYEYPVLFQTEWAWQVVDESHKLFGSLTITKGTLAGNGLKRLPLRENGRRVAISGTPFGRGGRVIGMFGTLHWLWPDEYTSFWRWADRYFEVTEEQVYIPGGRGATKPVKKIGALREGQDGEAFLRTLGPRILRRTKEEVLKDLPPKLYVEVVCEMEGTQLRQYKQLDVDAEVETANGILTVDSQLAVFTRAKQLANGAITIGPSGKVAFTGESSKIEMLWQKLEDRGILDDSGDVKLLVASQYNEFLDVIEARLIAEKIPYFKMIGATTDRKRDRMMEDFQAEGGPRVFLLNSATGGVSITLDSADEVHCMDEMWNPEDNEQLEDRVHRASRNHQVTIYYYRSEGSFDMAIAEDVEGKRVVQYNVLDGRRGIADVRNLIKYNPGRDD